MTPEQLLHKRYLVTNHYPFADVSVGEIITKRKNLNTDVFFDSLSTFTANFRLLEWWEMRSVEDMPDYVKWIKVSPFTKKDLPNEGVIENVEESIKYGDTFHIKVPSQINGITASYFLPATESDYTTYLNSLNKTQ